MWALGLLGHPRSALREEGWVGRSCFLALYSTGNKQTERLFLFVGHSSRYQVMKQGVEPDEKGLEACTG